MLGKTININIFNGNQPMKMNLLSDWLADFSLSLFLSFSVKYVFLFAFNIAGRGS